MIKLVMSEFEGKIDPEEFIDWFHTIKRVFEYEDISKDIRFKIIAI